MLDHQSQISIPTRGPVFVSAVASYSLAYDAADVVFNDNFVTALKVQIQNSIMLIGTVRKLSIDPRFLAKRWDITPEKAQKTIQAITQRGIRTIRHPSLSRWIRTNDRNLHYSCLAHLIFSDKMFASTVSRRGKKCAQVYASQWHPDVKHMKPCHCCL